MAQIYESEFVTVVHESKDINIQELFLLLLTIASHWSGPNLFLDAIKEPKKNDVRYSLSRMQSMIPEKTCFHWKPKAVQISLLYVFTSTPVEHKRASRSLRGML